MTTGSDRNGVPARPGGTATRPGTGAPEGPGRTAAAKAAAARTAAALNPRPSRVRPYQRRRRGPIIVVVTVLALLAAGTWVTVLSTASDGFGEGTCPAPVAGPPAGETVERSALYAVPPAPVSAVRVLVSNGGGQRQQANLVAAELEELGFARAAAPTNDPFYPDGDLECVGQLRFGTAGEAAASTLALVLPCVELVRDGRADDTVNVAVGTAFGDLSPARPARDALDQLSNDAGGSDGAANADPSAPDAGPPPGPTVDPALLEQARESTC
ncbi:envelope integrity protein Cei [Pseudonocardia lacus]|uniref:envelope integrity protein Cei n=1 Tax=Pseudonocardia lacus TaxID=2835865 RepID=UPI001BDD0CDE|nr:envelope integrity protein Cei [Pseudonocardia lacus]